MDLKIFNPHPISGGCGGRKKTQKNRRKVLQRNNVLPPFRIIKKALIMETPIGNADDYVLLHPHSNRYLLQ